MATDGHRRPAVCDARRGSAPMATALVMSCVVWLQPNGGVAGARRQDPGMSGPMYCSATADALFGACGSQVRADFGVAVAVCINVSHDAERADCFEEATEARDEGEQLCREQKALRLDTCASLGEGRYDPDFDPALFDDPMHPTNPNAYFPLNVGNKWTYQGGSESNTVEILNATKLIEGVTCIVANDTVTDDGQLQEDTDDWFAIARDGAIWYCGEEVKDFETFDGDDPAAPELVSIDGSFKAGRDGDKPGVIFLASPATGRTYVEEFSLANAEDVTEVLSTRYAFGDDPELDRLVPPKLAELLCSSDCVVTKNFSRLEPGIFARKYYAPGIGPFLEIEPDQALVIQLVACNFDPRCAQLPKP